MHESVGDPWAERVLVRDPTMTVYVSERHSRCMGEYQCPTKEKKRCRPSVVDGIVPAEDEARFVRTRGSHAFHCPSDGRSARAWSPVVGVVGRGGGGGGGGVVVVVVVVDDVDDVVVGVAVTAGVGAVLDVAAVDDCLIHEVPHLQREREREREKGRERERERERECVCV
jgi:hypothetical protein